MAAPSQTKALLSDPTALTHSLLPCSKQVLHYVPLTPFPVFPVQCPVLLKLEPSLITHSDHTSEPCLFRLTRFIISHTNTI